MYNPCSVVSCLQFGKIGNYWNQTETFEALQIYIDMNFEGLQDDILSMITGESVPVNTESFVNDMTTFRTEHDILTLLVHLGYKERCGYFSLSRYLSDPDFLPFKGKTIFPNPLRRDSFCLQDGCVFFLLYLL